MSVYELEHKLDEALESHKQELHCISSREAPLSREEILQLAKSSLYTLSEFRDAIVAFAKSK